MDLNFPTTAAVIGKMLGAPVVGEEAAEVHGLTALGEAREGSLSFCSHKKFGPLLNEIRGAVLLASSDMVRPELPLTFIVVPDPQKAFATIAKQFSRRASWRGISPQAVIHPSAEIGPDVAVAPFAVVGERTKIGAGSVIDPFASIGADVEIGERSEIHSHVTLYDRVRVGSRVRIFAGTVIGSDGFGMLSPDETGAYTEMPQIGTVVIEDDVRIGAKCTIDRATLGETRIGRGTKIDDQVHIGHNCKIGPHSILCGQVGLSGSVVLEERVTLGGQVGIAPGAYLEKGVRLAGASTTNSRLKGGQDYFGSPAVPLKEGIKMVRAFRKLPELIRRVALLEKNFGTQTDGEEQ